MIDSPTALVIAPHPDDEVLGAGATIARLVDAGFGVTVVAMCSDLPPLYPADVAPTVEAEARRAHALLGVEESVFLDLPSVEVSVGSVAALNGGLQDVTDRVRPSIVLAPFPDRHVDHKAAFEASMVVTRPRGSGLDMAIVAMYETVSETYWNAPAPSRSSPPRGTWTSRRRSNARSKRSAPMSPSTSPIPAPAPRRRCAPSHCSAAAKQAWSSPSASRSSA